MLELFLEWRFLGLLMFSRFSGISREISSFSKTSPLSGDPPRASSSNGVSSFSFVSLFSVVLKLLTLVAPPPPPLSLLSSSLKTLLLHSGQFLRLLVNHGSIQSTWYACLQGKILNI